MADNKDLREAAAGEQGLRPLTPEEARGYDPDEQVEKLHLAQQGDHRILVLDLDGGDRDDLEAARFFAARKASTRPQLARDLIEIVAPLRPGESYVNPDQVRFPGEEMQGG